MRALQWIFLVMLVIGFVFKNLHLSGGNQMTLLGFGGIGTLYLFFGFAVFNDISLSKFFKKESYSAAGIKKILTAEALGIGLALSLVGIGLKMLAVDNWLLPAGVVITALTLAVGLFSGIVQDSDPLRKHLLYKGVTIVLVGAALLFTPASSVIRFWHRGEDPAFVEKIIYVHDHPEDEKAKAELDEMYRDRY